MKNIKISKKVLKNYIKSILMEELNNNTTGDIGANGQMGGTVSISRDESGDIEEKTAGGQVPAGASTTVVDTRSTNPNFATTDNPDEGNLDISTSDKIKDIIALEIQKALG